MLFTGISVFRAYTHKYAILKVWGRIEVEGHDHGQVQNELLNQYRSLKGSISNYKGYFAEVHMSQVLLNSQNRTLPGAFFNSSGDIRMPFRFVFVRHRVRLSSGKGREIDILGAAGAEQWVCRVRDGRIGKGVLEELVSQADTVREDMNPQVIRMWIFANSGLTKEAEDFAKKSGILWSSRKEFDELLVYLGLRPLPEL